MLRHMERKHPEINLDVQENRMAEKSFRMEMAGQFRTAMDRQISEALAIARSGGMESEEIMNNCDEYNRCVLPELQTSNEIKMKEKAKRARENEANEYHRSSKRSKTNHLAEDEGEPRQPREGDKVETGQKQRENKAKINTHNPPGIPANPPRS